MFVDLLDYDGFQRFMLRKSEYIQPEYSHHEQRYF